MTVLGVLWPIANTAWWSCSNDGETVLAIWTLGCAGVAIGTVATVVARHYGYSEQLLLLAFRHTLRLGSLVLAAALVHTVVLNVSFDSCFTMKNSIFLTAVCYFLYNDLWALVGYVTRTEPIVKYNWTPLSVSHHLYRSAALYKVVLLAGLIAYNHDFVQDIRDYRGRNKDNPIAGVWQVESIDYLRGEVSEQTKTDLAEIDRIIMDKDRFGAVAVGDSLSYFEFIVNPKERQLEFWNFYDFRQMDMKGRYEQIAPDTLLYIGRNNQDSLRITLTLDKPSK